FCPEDGGPYVVKARFFGSRASFDASPALDGLFIQRAGDELHIDARLAGRAITLRLGPRAALVDDGRIRAGYDPATAVLVAAQALDGARGPHVLGGAVSATLRSLVRAALDPARINPVSARVGVSRP